MASIEVPDQAVLEQRTGNSLSYALGTGLLGDRWLRMWDGCESYSLRDRLQAASLSSHVLGFVNRVDDVVDAPNLDHSTRVATILSGAEHLLTGNCDCNDGCSSVMHEARTLNSDLLVDQPRLKATFSELFEAGLTQLEDDSLSSQEAAAVVIGATCMRLAVHAGECVSGKAAPTDIVAAANSLGSYSYFLDLAYEFESDIELGAQNYATLLVQEGSTFPAVKEQLQADAYVHLTQGADLLNAKQLRSYTSLAKLIHFKYMLQGSKSWLI